MVTRSPKVKNLFNNISSGYLQTGKNQWDPVIPHVNIADQRILQFDWLHHVQP